MIARKNIIVYLLLLSLAMPFLSQLLLQRKISRVRHEMKEKLERAALITVTLPGNQVEWVEPGKEIKINGRLFDIKTQHTENGTTVFTGLYDEEEKALKDLAAGGPKHDWLNSLLQKIFSGSYDHYFPLQPAIQLPVNPLAPNGIIVIKKYSSPFTGVAAPPPRAV